MSKCDTCYGCNKQEQLKFKQPDTCYDYQRAKSMCQNCKCELMKYPDEWICPVCQRDKLLTKSKGYFDKAIFALIVSIGIGYGLGVYLYHMFG